MFNISEVFISS